MTRSILLVALLVSVSPLSWGASSEIDEIIELLATDEKFPGGPGVQEAGEKIFKLTDSQREILIVEGLKSNKRAVRSQIAEMINREKNSEKYLDLLISLAENDADASVRNSALARVTSIDKIRAMGLHRRLKDDPDAMVRIFALKNLLASSDTPEDIEAVKTALREDHLLVRVGLTKTQMINGKPFDKKVAIEALGADSEWFRKHPLTSSGYFSRRVTPQRYAKYILRMIRGDAIDILMKVGTPEDIPFLERAGAKEATSKDKDLGFEVKALGTAEIIRLRSMPENDRLEYLKPKTRDSRMWMRDWAVGNLCGVQGGGEHLKSIAADPVHPANRSARSYSRRCSR